MPEKDHWNLVYSTKTTNAVSWYQLHAEVSLRLIREIGMERRASIIDVGGGASTLTDDLLARGYTTLSVLDLSAAALDAARHRLGALAASVSWIEADITTELLPENCYDIWHDRAVFHFLNCVEDRAAYLRNLSRALKPGGHIVVGAFAEDGPTQCSGLTVQRYSVESLYAEFGSAFSLVRTETEQHRTPAGAIQSFVYCCCRKSEL